MVLRNLDGLNARLESGAKNASQYNQSLVRMRTSLSGLIVPGLGAFGAISLLQGAMGGATGDTLALTQGQAALAQAMFKIRAGIQDAVAPALVSMADHIEALISRFGELDRTTGGWLTRIGTGVVGAVTAITALSLAIKGFGFVASGLRSGISGITGLYRGLANAANAAANAVARVSTPNAAFRGFGAGAGATGTAGTGTAGAGARPGFVGQQINALRADVATLNRITQGASQRVQTAFARAGAATGQAGSIAGAAARGLGPGLALGLLDYFAAREDDTRHRQDQIAEANARAVQERRDRGEFVPGPGYYRPEPLRPGQQGFHGPVQTPAPTAVTVNQHIYNYGSQEDMANRMMLLVQQGLADIQGNP